MRFSNTQKKDELKKRVATFLVSVIRNTGGFAYVKKSKHFFCKIQLSLFVIN